MTGARGEFAPGGPRRAGFGALTASQDQESYFRLSGQLRQADGVAAKDEFRISRGMGPGA